MSPDILLLVGTESTVLERADVKPVMAQDMFTIIVLGSGRTPKAASIRAASQYLLVQVAFSESLRAVVPSALPDTRVCWISILEENEIHVRES